MIVHNILPLMLAAVVVMSTGIQYVPVGRDPADVEEGRVDILEFYMRHVNDTVTFTITLRETPLFNATESAYYLFSTVSVGANHSVNLTLHVEVRGSGMLAYLNTSSETIWLGKDDVMVDNRSIKAFVPEELFGGYIPGFYLINAVATYREWVSNTTIVDSTETVLTSITGSENREEEGGTSNPAEPLALVCCMTCGVIFVILVFVAAWVAMDAHDRGDEPILWFLITLFLPVLGLVLYLLLRGPGKGK